MIGRFCLMKMVMEFLSVRSWISPKRNSQLPNQAESRVFIPDTLFSFVPNAFGKPFKDLIYFERVFIRLESP